MSDNTSLTAKEILKLEEVAEILKVSKNTLRDWDKKGILRAFRFGARKDRRYDKETVLQFQQQTA